MMQPEPIGATQFLLLLHSVPQLGEKALARLLGSMAQRRLSPEEFLQLPVSGLQSECELDPRSAAFICENRSALIEKSAAAARALRAYPLQLVCVSDAAYPRRLEQYADSPPPVLYALGAASLLDAAGESNSDRFTFTIAVSRQASPDSLTMLDEIATQLAIRGGVPATGHDRPEYQRLALAAQRRNLPAIYVFDRGLRSVLGPEFNRPPFAAARIRDAEFELGRDMAISPFRLDDHCIGGNNKRRDGLVFALSDVVLALDIREQGVMYAECLRAHRQKRHVFVAEGGRDGNDALRRAGVATWTGALPKFIP